METASSSQWRINVPESHDPLRRRRAGNANELGMPLSALGRWGCFAAIVRYKKQNSICYVESEVVDQAVDTCTHNNSVISISKCGIQLQANRMIYANH
jgi:hypothetical protein